MKPIQRILVAVKNPRAGCHRTIAKAARLAHGLGADLELFHAIDVPLYVDAASTADEWIASADRNLRTWCSRKLERIATRLRNCGLQVSTSVEWDYPASEAIVRRSQQVGADLIIAERHGSRHVAPSILHATDWELLHRSSVTTLLVTPSTPRYRHPVVLAAVDPSHAHAKPATLDDQILRTGSSVAAGLRGALHAVHAYAPTLTHVPLEALPAIAADIEADAAAQASGGFDRLLASAGIPNVQPHLIRGRVEDAIRETIQSTGCSILVMGAIGRGGLRGLLIGNTAERVLSSRLACDLLVVKAQELETQIPRAPRGARFASVSPAP